MPKKTDKPDQSPLTPKEQIQNLVEGLCEEPFQLDWPEDSEYGFQLNHITEKLGDLDYDIRRATSTESAESEKSRLPTRKI